MTRDEAVATIKRGLGFLQGTTHDDAIIAALKQAQTAREGGRSLPWFLLQEDQTLAITADTANYALPTGFFREDIDFNPVTVTDSDGDVTILEPLAYDEAKALYKEGASGTPEVYVVRNTEVWLFPTPDAALTLTWSYYAADTVLDTNVENKWLADAPYVLIADAGLKMAKDLRDQEAAAIFTADKSEWDAWYTRRMTEQREANTRYVVGKYA